MNKPLKFSSAKQRILFGSDFHCQHNPDWGSTPPLWKSRGFTSISEHDAWIKAQWFKLVDEHTIVFLLGDAIFSDPKGEGYRQMTNWPGRVLSLAGNHFSGLKQIYREAVKSRIADHETLYPVTMGNITLMGESMHAYIDAQSVYMQHYAPYIWPEIGAGGFACAGHSHGRAGALNPDAVNHGKVVDCGVDNAIAFNGTPFFSWDEIKRIMAKKPVVARDHH